MGDRKEELKGKVAVITGGGGVLCSEMARTLAALEVKVAVLGLHRDKVAKVSKEINDLGGTSIPLEANVLDKDALKLAHEELISTLGACDILINGAGGNHPKGTTSMTHFMRDQLDDPALTTFYDLDAAGIEFVFNLNFLGTLLPSQIFTKDMTENGGVVINVSSMNAFTPLTKIPAYSAAKSAISNFTQWLAVHFSKVGIRVNALAPGFFLTDQNRTLLTKPDGSLTERGNQIIDQTPMARFGEAKDLSSTLVWLCDPASAFVTGVVIPVDGGFSAYSGV